MNHREIHDLLVAARPPELDVPPHPDRRLRDLRTALATEPDGAAAPRAGVPRRSLLVGAAAAVIVAVAVVVPLATSGPPSARQVLLAAAASAEKATTGAGMYWHRRSLNASVIPVPGPSGTYLMEQRNRLDTWIAGAAGTDSIEIRTPLGVHALRPSDDQAWREAGAPTEIRVDPTGPVTISTAPGEPRVEQINDGDDVVTVGGRALSVAELQALPSDPAALDALLRGGYDDDIARPGSDRPDPDTWMFRVTTDLIRSAPITPEVRSAAFTVLAGLPDMTVLPDVTDGLGRSGTAVAMRRGGDGGGVVEFRVIVDASAGRALGVEFRVIEPGPRHAGVPVGVRGQYDLVESAGWTDEQPPVPPR